MFKEPGKFRQASFSDVHLGHHSTPTEHILANLTKAFPDNAETGKLDMIWIVGDFFDRLLSAPDHNVALIKMWIYRFLLICGRRQIKVRVMEGTKSHDWAQNKLFEQVVTLGNLDVDMKYVDTLSIEYIADFNMHVLYVPDDWRPNPDDTWREILQLLQEQGLEQVDYALVHGTFDFQLPPHLKLPRHISERFLSIVRHYCFIGHVHLTAKHGRILSNGSFDRIAHGEEGPKGHWRVTQGGVDGDEIVFVENTGAQIYKTIVCTGLSVEDAIAKIDQEVPLLPDGSYVRIEAAKGEAIMVSLEALRRRYGNIRSWSTKEAKEKDVQPKLLTDLRSTFVEINITSANIEELVMAKVQTLTTDPILLDRCRNSLKAFV